MPAIDPVAAKVLRKALERFGQGLERDLAAVLRETMRGWAPRELGELREELMIIDRQLAAGGERIEVHDVHARLLKSVVITQRRALAAEVDAPRQRTAHRDAIRFLEAEVRVLDGVMEAAWFDEVSPARLPRLTDYVSIRFAEAARGDAGVLAPRVWDEKFHILEAPGSFLPDLAHYRARCELREAPVAVAFLDIDDFKAFNTEYGEARVDRDVLPPFMERLEAHVFAHGHAYRFGGDEYVVLLPNVDRVWAVAFLRAFQTRLAELVLPGIRTLPTVSIGVCHVPPGTFLTEREIQERAGRAKNHAKAAGKNRIAIYEGARYRDTDLRLADPAVPS